MERGKGSNREEKVQFNFPSASVSVITASRDVEEQEGAQQAGGHLPSTLRLHPSATLLAEFFSLFSVFFFVLFYFELLKLLRTLQQL